MTRGRANGFTLVEVLVTIAIVGVLMSLCLSTLAKARAQARVVQCIGNQRQISYGLQLFYNDHKTFPSDLSDYPLRVSLQDYLSEPKTFKCPNDAVADSVDSYQPYYVRRSTGDGGGAFALGCPRHTETASLFANGSVSLLPRARVLAGDIEVRQDSPPAQRTFSSGALKFDDNSQLTIASAGTGFGVTVVESFRLGDGTLYTIVRISGEGKVNVSVTPGSKFEVVTPSSVVGVRGTEFEVVTTAGGQSTCVSVSSGQVRLTDLATGETQELGKAEEASVAEATPGCIHCRRHCRRGRHCPRCPLHPRRARWNDDDD